MIDIIIHRKEITRAQLYRWAFRSVAIGPVLGILPGIAWSFLILGKIGEDYQISLLVGTAVGFVFGVFAAQGLSWATLRASNAAFCALALGAALIGFVCLSIFSYFASDSTPEWAMGIVVFTWFAAMWAVGRRFR